MAFPRRSLISLRVARRAGLVFLFGIAAVLGSLSGVYFAYAGELPQVSKLEDYQPNIITRVLADDGATVGEFAIERRVVVPYDQIPLRLRQAIIATEDADFARHVGIDLTRLAVAAIRDIVQWRKAEGASTLTQQLSRKLFLTDEKTWDRKVKEALLAFEIEKKYTKNEILTLYCNQIYFGHGAYGVEAAAQTYFGKTARDLTLEEAAMIAGLARSNDRTSPYVDMRRALQRRNYVLARMASEGYINRTEATEAQKRPIVLRSGRSDPTIAPYFIEEIRKYLERKYGSDRLYKDGLTVQSTLNRRLQAAATRALDRGLRALDKRRGFRPIAVNVLRTGGSLEKFTTRDWRRPAVKGDIVTGLVEDVNAKAATIRVGSQTGTVGREGIAWTRRATPPAVLKRGDVTQFSVVAVDEATGHLTLALEQEPQVEGALIAIENRTGAVKALIGGYSWSRSKFDRATQALRQTGSTFKPFVYTAAIDKGFTPVSTLLDAPVTYQAEPGKTWSPHNYDFTFEGPVTLRHALEKSRNVPTIRLLDDIGVQSAITYAHKMGITNEFPPFLPIGIGAGEATLIEMTSAFSVFPNQGVRMTPYLVGRVTDREGNQIEERQPEATEAIRADTAYVMLNLLRGVIQRGTATRAASLNWPLGGKTGTTDDFTDAWFIGFDPAITCGVWVGLDEKKPLGRGEDGAHAALPIWIDFMREVIAIKKTAEDFTAPSNIVFVPIDHDSGGLTTAGAPGAFMEAFIAGTEPGGEGR